MDRYVITPRGKKYLIEAIAEGGARKTIGAYPTEEAALQRLKVLQPKEEIPDRSARYLPQVWPS